MRKRHGLCGALVVVAMFAGLPAVAQTTNSVAGTVILESSRQGIPEVAMTLCLDTGREVISQSESMSGLPARDQVRSIRIVANPNQPPQITVTSTSVDCEKPMRTATDRDGRFVFTSVLPGPYKVYAQREGYISAPVKGAYPQVPAQAVSIIPRQPVSDLSFFLIKSGVLAGAVRDVKGQPLPSVPVRVMSANGAVPIPRITGQTDDRGQYRLFGVPPGDFRVVAQPLTIAPAAAIPPTYYPSTIVEGDAKIIAMREGEEVTAIDIVLRALPTEGR
jgi:hypothetical protein